VHILGSSAKLVTIGQVGLIRQVTLNEEGFRPGVSNSFGDAGHTVRYHSVGGPQCF